MLGASVRVPEGLQPSGTDPKGRLTLIFYIVWSLLLKPPLMSTDKALSQRGSDWNPSHVPKEFHATCLVCSAKDDIRGTPPYPCASNALCQPLGSTDPNLRQHGHEGEVGAAACEPFCCAEAAQDLPLLHWPGCTCWGGAMGNCTPGVPQPAHEQTWRPARAAAGRRTGAPRGSPHPPGVWL